MNNQFSPLSVKDIQSELKRVRHRKKHIVIVRSAIYTLITVAAVAVLVAMLWMPVLQIHGNSMTPTVNADDIIVTLKGGDFETGDIIAFYYNNKVLVKRVIARAGDWVDIDKLGNVYVNSVLLDEPYVSQKALGDGDVSFPYQVPESKLFVMGDHRGVSIDSRSSSIGCIGEEQIVGKIVFRVWPLNEFGIVE